MLLEQRICLACGTLKSATNTKGAEKWYKYEDGRLCHQCNSRIVQSPKQNIITNAKWKGKSIRFKDKRFNLMDVNRLGVCSKCKRSIEPREIKVTHLHHEKYDETNPLAYTKELCVGCHNRQHKKIRSELN